MLGADVHLGATAGWADRLERATAAGRFGDARLDIPDNKRLMGLPSEERPAKRSRPYTEEDFETLNDYKKGGWLEHPMRRRASDGHPLP